MDKITLDREVFKALASDTRLDILKALDVRQKTVTELAKELSLNKATVFEHLEKLAAVGLIQKLEDDRKWVYWQLTWTGRRLLHPEKITLSILLSTAGGAIATMVVALWLWIQSGLAPDQGDLAAKGGPAESEISARTFDAPADSGPAEAAASSADPMLLAAAIALGVLAVALVAAAVWVHLRAAKKRAAGPAA